MSSASAAKTMWIGINIPHRQRKWNTYIESRYEDLPVITIFELFTNIKTMTDLRINIWKVMANTPSCTACYFQLPTEGDTGEFYRDQQDCVVWSLNSAGQVVTDSGYMVASSLPEFLSRWRLENMIWYKHGKDYTPEELAYIEHYRQMELQGETTCIEPRFEQPVQEAYDDVSSESDEEITVRLVKKAKLF